MEIAILGSGVIGLSTGILLARAGHHITIYAKDQPPNTVSDVACAIWLPLLAGDPNLISPKQIELYKDWAEKSWNAFAELIGEDYGVHSTTLYRMFPEKEPEPYFSTIVPNFEQGYDSHLPSGLNYKWSFTTFIIDTPVYMPSLLKDFQREGGNIRRQIFSSREELRQLNESVIFNCTGLGAIDIFGDSKMYPVKGQLLLHAPIPLNFSLSAGEFCFIPRLDALVLGALFETEFATLEPTETNTEKIWSTIQSWITNDIDILPTSSVKLSKAKITTVLAGLRPYRPEGIRLETEHWDNKLIIHNYGHGGSGVTFSWGSAKHAIQLMEEYLDK